MVDPVTGCTVRGRARWLACIGLAMGCGAGHAGGAAAAAVIGQGSPAQASFAQVSPAALGVMSPYAVAEGSALPHANVQYALSGTTLRIGGFVVRSPLGAPAPPADLRLDLLSPRPGVRLVPAGTGWDLVLSSPATQPGARLAVRMEARSASRGQRAVLHGRAEVLPRREVRLHVPAGGGRFHVADRAIEFPPLPAARGTAVRDVTVHYAILPAGNGLLSRVLPTGTLEASPRSAEAVGHYRIVPLVAAGTAKAPPEATSLMNELDTTAPYAVDPAQLGTVWADYTGPYISAGRRRLPVADADSVNSASGQLNSLVSTGWPVAQWAQVTPVIFVHGFQDHATAPAPHFSGGKAYWGNLPNLVRQYTGNPLRRFAPFEYRWNTDAQFVVQGAELAAAINAVYGQTGRRPILVAHAYGGLLVRTVLQNLAGAEGELARGRVDSVVTLGTPHSGVARLATTLHGVALPAGREPGLISALDSNAQVSTHVAGAPVLAAYETDLQRLGLTAEPGVDVAALATTAAQLPPVRLAVGLGVDQDVKAGSSDRVYRRGDGLLTTEGQRLFPGEVASPLRAWSAVEGSGAEVKELVLGHLGALESIRAGGLVDAASLEPADPWAPEGYLHGALNGRNDTEPAGGRETQVPGTPASGCDKPDTCQHASWRLLRELLARSPRINDTGQTTCVDPVLGSTPIACAGTGQDGEFGRDVAAADDQDGRAGFSYVKIGRNGEDLPASATAWDCVRDQVTGLVWEVKTADGGLRDRDLTYTHQDNGQSGDASTFVDAVNSTGLCGASDWRLPTRYELQGLVDYSGPYPGPAIDSDWFPHTVGREYWASTAYPGYPRLGWFVLFGNGYVGEADRSRTFAVRLVREGK